MNSSKLLADSLADTGRTVLTPAQLEAARRDPNKMRTALDLADAGDKGLIDFAAALWPHLDPGVPFVRGWAIEAIAEHLEAVTKGQIKKLLINVPPGFSKSLLVNVYWPAWEWGPKGRPQERYVCTSYDQTLVIRDNIKCRHLLLSDEYQMVYGDVFHLTDDQNTKVRFANNKTGWKAAKAITGLTGDRGSRFIFDDPQSVLGAESDAEVDTIETSFAHAMPTRVQTKDDPFVGIMQRLRENDISGFILENDLGFEHLVIPMHYTDNHPYKTRTSIGWVDPRSIEGNPAQGYFVVGRDPATGAETRTWRSCYHDGMVASGYLASPDRFPPEQVDDLEKTMATKGGTSAIAGQMEQRPYAEGGEMFKEEWWGTWTGPIPKNATLVRGWDFASSTSNKADWTVGVLMARLPKKAGFIIVDVVRFRGSVGTVRKRVVQTAKADGKRVRISLPKDPGAGGEWVIADFKSDLVGFDVHTSREESSKVERARPYAAQCEPGVGKFYIHENLHKQQAEQMPAGITKAKIFIAEHKAFPKGAHDDQVDGGSRAFGVLAETRERSAAAEAPVSYASTSTATRASVYEGDGDGGY